ncbi:MAG TPA: M1 family aminopeptidase [Longimicrobiaceae bacterium]|nr:M1 family aminopeptidase [Longimicrobiaceae bacterium]
MNANFLETVRFEIRYYLRRISTYVYFGIFFALSFLLVCAIGGAFDSVSLAIGGSGGNVHVNSPYVITMITGVLSLFGVLVTAALLGNAIFRDFEAGIHPLFFTSPISRFSYLGGRFAGALIVDLIIFTSIPLGLMAATVVPILDAERFGPFRLLAYVQPYLLVAVPIIVFTGAIFFGLAALTRQMLPNYVGGVLMLIGYMLAGNLASDIENEQLAAILDPFGLNAISLATKYWTPVEKNMQMVALDGVVLWNRLLWMAVALAIFGIVYSRFKFSHVAGERKSTKARAAEAGPPAAAYAAPRRLTLPLVSRQFDRSGHLAQFSSLTWRSFRGIVANRYFFAIVGAGLLFLIFSAGQVGKLYGTTTWPVTYAVLEVLGGTFALFMLIIITFYAGELIWRERDVRLSQVQDAMPMPTWVPFLAKLAALSMVVVILQGAILIAGVMTQAVKGYFNFEIGLYIKTLFGLQLVDYLLLCVLVMLIHVLVNNKYMAHLIVVLYFIFTAFMGQLGLEHGLYQFGSDAGRTYSDMNGYGPFLVPFFWFKAYWAGWALMLAVFTNLFWVRGEETGMNWRVRLARLRLTRPALSIAGLAMLMILGFGGFVFYNTNVLNEFRTGQDMEQASVEYERTYERFEGIPQPRITGVNLRVEIYPEERDVTASGVYRVLNKTDVPIDSVHIRIPSQVEIRDLSLSRPSRMVLDDEEHGYHIFALQEPLMPGDSMSMTFQLAYITEGFPNRVSRTSVVENGTFFNSSLMPSFGYDPNLELSDDETRRKYGLEPKPRMAEVDDLEARQNTYISQDADWIEFEATVGTSADQIAIAPGYLTREWREGDRRYFHYEMDSPILNFYSFLSADYAVRRDQWNDVAIEIFYHPGHEYNLDRMIDAVKKSLDYYTENFGPYQHRQVRILEFPRYASFAQSFPNTIPYSEAIGFIARVEGEDDIDYPFYVTAHEVAHQWWAHQVIGGNVQGSTLLSETLSQYSALMVMEEEYGPEHMKRFLKYELDRYLTGRAFERKREMPLLKVENQGYIHYSKGSLVMYALKDYIGEDNLNAALRAYLEDVKFQEPPYTNSLELYGYLKAATPDSLQSMLADLFEHITLWDNRAVSATAQPTADGRYSVTLTIQAAKVRADSIGTETEVPMNDPIDIGVFAAPEDGSDLGEPLYLQKHRITSGEQQITVIVDEQPAKAGIDPYHKLIDRHSDDNVVEVGAGGGE